MSENCQRPSFGQSTTADNHHLAAVNTLVVYRPPRPPNRFHRPRQTAMEMLGQRSRNLREMTGHALQLAYPPRTLPGLQSPVTVRCRFSLEEVTQREPVKGIRHTRTYKARGEESDLLINRSYPVFSGHVHLQNNVEIPACVRVLVCWHTLVTQNDRGPRGNNLAFGTRYSHTSAIEVIDHYAIKAQKRFR